MKSSLFYNFLAIKYHQMLKQQSKRYCNRNILLLFCELLGYFVVKKVSDFDRSPPSIKFCRSCRLDLSSARCCLPAADPAAAGQPPSARSALGRAGPCARCPPLLFSRSALLWPPLCLRTDGRPRPRYEALFCLAYSASGEAASPALPPALPPPPGNSFFPRKIIPRVSDSRRRRPRVRRGEIICQIACVKCYRQTR